MDIINDCVPVPRYFNQAVSEAQSHYVDSLDKTFGQYVGNGYERAQTNGYGDETRYRDNNHDGWVDEKIIKSYNKKVVVQNTNSHKDNMFDYYTEYIDGKTSKIVMDKDKNGAYDIVELYEEGDIQQRIEDTNGDKEPDLYTFYTDEGMKKVDTRNWLEKITSFIFGN